MNIQHKKFLLDYESDMQLSSYNVSEDKKTTNVLQKLWK